MPTPTVTAPTFLPGYTSTVIIDSAGLNAIVPVTGWSADHKVSTFDATNSTSAGAQITERAIESMNGSFDALWRYTTGAPAFLVGTLYPLTLGVNSTESYTFMALVTSIAVTTDVKGAVTYTCSFDSHGPITVAS